MKKFKIKNIFDGKVFVYLCRFAFVMFAVVVISQIGLKNEPTREVFTKIESYEGISGEPSEDYHILVNGEKVDVLDSCKKELELYAPSVVEIYPVKKGKHLKVEMTAKSDNIEMLMDKKVVAVEDSIEVLNKIIFK